MFVLVVQSQRATSSSRLTASAASRDVTPFNVFTAQRMHHTGRNVVEVAGLWWNCCFSSWCRSTLGNSITSWWSFCRSATENRNMYSSTGNISTDYGLDCLARWQVRLGDTELARLQFWHLDWRHSLACFFAKAACSSVVLLWFFCVYCRFFN